jgi:simple sugar transport system substrate-binding protein
MYTEGNTAVDWLLGQGLSEYNVILIRGQLGSAAELGRSDAVVKAAAAGKLNIVADGTGGDSWSGEEARKVVEAAIQSGTSFNVIYAQNDGMADGAVQALDAAGISHGKGGDVVIMGFDFNRFALRNVQAGIWNYAGQCSPRQASQISEWIKALEAGQSIPSGIVFNKEIGVDCDTITEDIIVNMGINEDPGQLSTPPAPAGKSTIKVGIVNLPPEESGYRQANVEDMNAVFSAANGYDMSQNNTADNSEQIAAAEGYIRDGVDYLLISAANATGWDGVFASAKAAGVTVFLFDRLIDTAESNFKTALVSDMYTEGNTAVDWLLGQGLSEYNVILIRGQLGSAAELGRSDAVLKARDAGKLNVVADGTGGDSWSGEEARKVVEAAIQSGTSFNVIYAQNDGMADGAVQALDAAGISHGKGGDVIVMGFDFNRFALRNVQAGIWNYAGQCSPRQAAQISEWIKALESGQSIPTGIVFNKEIGVDYNTITEDIIQNMGINDDPGKLN